MKTKTPSKTRRPSGTVKALAEKLHVSPRRVHDLLTAGMPEDPTAAQTWRKEQSGNADASDSAEKLRQERIRLVQEQRRKIALENAEREKRLLDAGEVFAAHYAMASKIRARILSFSAQLPPVLAGLPEHSIAEVLHRETLELLAEISSESFITQEP